MQAGAFIRAVQMLGVDVGQVTTNLALTKGQLEDAQEIAKEINLSMWMMPQVSDAAFMSVPIGQYQTVLRLIDALG